MRRYREMHTLPQERFAVLCTAIIYVLLAAASFERENPWAGVARIGAIFAISLAFILFRPRRHNDGYVHLFTLYYLLVFLIVYYFPLLVDSSPHLRPRGYNYLLHLSILIAQGLRPHVRGGLAVLLLLSAHSLLTILFDPRPLDGSDLLRLTAFLWLGAIVLYIERLNYLNSSRYFQLAMRKEREREEVKLAEQVHKNLFPAFRENDSIRLSSRRMAPELTGGDFFDLVYLREGNLGLFFTDISGHGISSAMMSAAVKVIVQGMPYRNRMDPPALLSHVDRVMAAEYGSHHASAIYLFFDFQAKQARFANAGHPALLRSTAGGPFEEIESEGALLGYGLRDPIASEVVLPLGSGDRFLVYTDGLLECDGTQSQAFMPQIQEFLPGLEAFPGDDLIEELLRRVRARPEFVAFRDDVMLVLLEVK